MVLSIYFSGARNRATLGVHTDLGFVPQRRRIVDGHRIYGNNKTGRRLVDWVDRRSSRRELSGMHPSRIGRKLAGDSARGGGGIPVKTNVPPFLLQLWDGHVRKESSLSSGASSGSIHSGLESGKFLFIGIASAVTACSPYKHNFPTVQYPDNLEP